jgi:hypothetical protein
MLNRRIDDPNMMRALALAASFDFRPGTFNQAVVVGRGFNRDVLREKVSRALAPEVPF